MNEKIKKLFHNIVNQIDNLDRRTIPKLYKKFYKTVMTDININDMLIYGAKWQSPELIFISIFRGADPKIKISGDSLFVYSAKQSYEAKIMFFSRTHLGRIAYFDRMMFMLYNRNVMKATLFLHFIEKFPEDLSRLASSFDTVKYNIEFILDIKLDKPPFKLHQIQKFAPKEVWKYLPKLLQKEIKTKDTNCTAILKTGKKCHYKGKYEYDGELYCGIHIKKFDKKD